MWTDSSVIYQIYPLGAFGAPFENDFEPEHRLAKFEEWIPRLKDMGVDAVLFNPLFESTSHGYDTIDMSKVDSRLGDNKDLKEISKLLHKNGIRLLLDAVFNHVGRGFAPFQDVLKNRENSPYKDWFFIDFNGNNSYNDGLWYQNWEGNDPLVKLNVRYPEVQKYLFDRVDEWMDEYGVDGLRLDVAYCLDKDFLKALRRHVKEKNPEFFLYGETLHGDYNQWVNDEMLDSSTNYEAYKGLYSSFNSGNFFEILYSFNRQFGSEPWCLYTGKHLICFVDNHDVNRIASQLENKKHLAPLYAMLFTMPGIPAIYYGSEWGIEGKKNYNDTALRPEIKELEENDLTEIIDKLIEIKHEHSALHNGNYRQVELSNRYCLFERNDGKERILAAFNIEDRPIQFNFNEDVEAIDLMTGKKGRARDLLNLEPNSFKILQVS